MEWNQVDFLGSPDGCDKLRAGEDAIMRKLLLLLLMLAIALLPGVALARC